LESLGIFRYAVRDVDNPVTVADLDANDILIIEYYDSTYDPCYYNILGLNPIILSTGITGRIVITGHDPDWHMWRGTTGSEAGAKFLENAINWVKADSGTGLIVLADGGPERFRYLPQAWGISATSPNPYGSDEHFNDEYIDRFTDAAVAAKLFDGLDCNDMSYWDDSFHDVFTEWGSDFMPMEFGGTSHEDVITLARGNVYDISLSIANDVDPNTCVEPGTEIIYTLYYNYPAGAGPNVGNVFIIDTLPHGATYKPYSSTGDYDHDEHTLTWDIGTLEPGDSGSVSFTVTVNDKSEPGGELQDFAALRSDAGTVMARNDIPVCCSGGIIFVCAQAPDGGAGRNWATAYNNLQDALARARRGCGSTIWVAQGTYKPGPSVDDSFRIPPDVSVLGGFSSGEDPETFDVNDRNLRMCRTVLSGQIDASTRNDRVVTMGNNTLLDGMVIENGQQYGVYGQNVDFTIANCTVQNTLLEDGIRCEGGNLTCTNCIVRDNAGNGIYCNAQGKTLSIQNANINNNGSHGVFVRNSTADIRNSIVHHNGGRSSEYYGVRLRDVPVTSTIRNCTIACNANEGISNDSPNDATVRNCILWYNQTHSPINPWQTAGPLNVTYSCITDPNDPNCISWATDARNNIHCQPGFANTEPYLIPNFHLAADSHCIDAGLGSSFPGETDIDANDRVVNGTVDIGADEVACEVNLYNRADLDADGIINFYDFAVFGNAWGGHDPNDPLVKNGQLVVDQDLLDRWDAVCNFNTDYVIDMKDFKVMADNWLWTACWYTQAPAPLPPFDYSSASYGMTFEPNEPEWDPNDPNGFGMMSTPSGGEEMSLAFEDAGISSPDPELTIQQLEETIDFLYDIIDEVPEETDNITEMIRSLQEEMDAISEMESLGWYSQ
jgi:hypothetical protein